MSTQNLLAPVGYYDRLVWIFGILILAYLELVLNVENRAVTLLFYLSIPFSFAWYHKVDEPERPPIPFLIARIGLGFIMGLGLLAMILFIFSNKGWAFQLWGMPNLASIGAISTSALILTQFGVGIIEEGVFRVALPRMMYGAKINPFAIILLASWAFGMFHWNAYGGSIGGIAIAIFAGIMQSLAYSTSQSAIGIMLGHAIWNIAISGLLSGLLYYLAWILILIGIIYYLRLKYGGNKHD